MQQGPFLANGFEWAFSRPFGRFDTQQNSMDSSSTDSTADVVLLWHDASLPSQEAFSERVSHDRNLAEKASNQHFHALARFWTQAR